MQQAVNQQNHHANLIQERALKRVEARREASEGRQDTAGKLEIRHNSADAAKQCASSFRTAGGESAKSKNKRTSATFQTANTMYRLSLNTLQNTANQIRRQQLDYSGRWRIWYVSSKPTAKSANFVDSSVQTNASECVPAKRSQTTRVKPRGNVRVTVTIAQALASQFRNQHSKSNHGRATRCDRDIPMHSRCSSLRIVSGSVACQTARTMTSTESNAATPASSSRLVMVRWRSRSNASKMQEMRHEAKNER